MKISGFKDQQGHYYCLSCGRKIDKANVFNITLSNAYRREMSPFSKCCLCNRYILSDLVVKPIKFNQRELEQLHEQMKKEGYTHFATYAKIKMGLKEK